MSDAVLDLRNLCVAFGDEPPVVSGIDLTIRSGQILVLVGESGSGKSATALALMRLLPQEANVTADLFRFQATDVLAATVRDLERLRGKGMAIVLQDSSLSLHPLKTIGDQIIEALQTHEPARSAEAREAALAMLDRVQITGGPERLGLFAHELSGGMRQRVLIAMALICRPALLIADEPTASLDAIVQRQVVRLMGALRTQLGSAMLLITHDLALAHEVADDIAVMLSGQIVERGRRADIFEDPQHPYTLQLMAALAHDQGAESLVFHAPRAPEGGADASGCVFRFRCPVVADRCRRERPVLVDCSPSHSVACWRAPLEGSLA